MRFLLPLLLVVSAAPSQTMAQTLDERVQRELPSLLSTYKTLHANPELSMKEKNTSALVASQLRAMGYEVTERVGKYVDGDAAETCYGVVAVMRNGKGPVVLLRADMDGLPVTEATNLPYASKNVGVMHACGHDIHMTTLLGAAKVLADTKAQWQGTIVLIGQPAEEGVRGAAAMLRDGLYERFPKPDFAVALHDWALLEAGKVGYRPGFIMAGSDSVDITVRGSGGHGAAPEKSKDPIVVAAEIIMSLQTIVSRQTSAFEPVVVTVGQIHGGTRRNIIPDEVKMDLTVRTYKPEIRKQVLEAIERTARGIAMAAGMPADRPPVVEQRPSESVPPTYNDPTLANRLAAAVRKEIGDANVVEGDQSMVGEDFGRFSLDGRIPAAMFFLGATNPATVKAGGPLPGLHSAQFAPDAELTLRTGVRTAVSMVMDLLTRKP